ncbi:pseudouridine synthase [Rhodococcus sp. Eu-32]|uniref:pseudouridine synthase n=1 Tax=Rhodococcus sp. Eu-32 TaxID=1017319 RepID=UPI000DF45140|nr:pseudouridine synthase [Rhodococcus sp. Eu-32]RRQ25196.1 pseudouridine synthase [Rhodococcus sp. Eu-32]
MPQAPLPLPFRDGLAPLRIRLPHGDVARTLLEFLTREHPMDPWIDSMAAGEVVDEKGRRWDAESRYAPGRFVYFYRVPPPEIPVPFDLDVLYDADGIVVVDKPHFLATIPRGMHVTETATVRLRRMFDDADLTPAHRLDRATAGVLLFTRDVALRRPYQELFSTRQVLKEYEAIAVYDPSLEFPRTVRSRILKDHGVMVAREEPGEPNSETRIELIEELGDRARYRLFPHTGRTHQLRIHLSSLGIPIQGDPYYPDYTRTAADDFGTPLQLLARAVEFDDPITGERRRFESRRTLAGWTLT